MNLIDILACIGLAALIYVCLIASACVTIAGRPTPEKDNPNG
jgi:hypothetical protein